MFMTKFHDMDITIKQVSQNSFWSIFIILIFFVKINKFWLKIRILKFFWTIMNFMITSLVVVISDLLQVSCRNLFIKWYNWSFPWVNHDSPSKPIHEEKNIIEYFNLFWVMFSLFFSLLLLLSEIEEPNNPKTEP